MRSALRTEVVALDRAGEALADGGARHVDLLAGFEHGFHGNDRARRKFGGLGGIQAEFFEDAAGFDAGLGVVARLRLGDARGTTGAISQLDGGIAVGFQRLHLGHAVVRHVQHGHGDGLAIFREHTGHADLATHQTQSEGDGRGCRIRHCFLHRARGPRFCIPDCDWSGLIGFGSKGTEPYNFASCAPAKARKSSPQNGELYIIAR